eukprot:TRINITY_DN12403_c0_g2_i4.p1 TRINITY_DN12403_c0_g2~~TRINITY_DN12403_c0_g2_i4.p1  ORF type:complete len:753 (+),score=246.92 TRINITY_DN12403_c0_g2_i4:255-2513(+)
MSELDQSMGAHGGTEIGSFPCIYMGSVNVRSAEGADVCADAILRVKAMKSDIRKVNLVVTSRGVFIIEQRSEDCIKTASIGTVSFVSIDPTDKKLFAYITHEADLNLYMCHCFQVKKQVDRIPAAMNEAFMLFSKHGDAEKKLKRIGSKKAANMAAKQRRGSNAEAKAVSLGTYEAKYLGSVAVDESRGNKVALSAYERIKALKGDARAVEVVVLSDRLDVVEASSQTVIKAVPIMEISFTAGHPKDSKVFLWITNDARLGLKYCHAFQSKKTKGAEILNVISSAFAAMRQRVERATGDESALLELGVVPQAKVQTDALGVHDAKFIGSLPVPELKGKLVVEDALARARHDNKFAESVVLTISAEGVRTIEGLTGEVVSAVLISDISFCTTAGVRKEVFAFISKNDRLKRITCHLYECLDAHKLTLAIGQAFKAAQEEALARKGNPFAPTSKERETVKGPLFRYQIHRSDMEAVKPIGAGAFGQVFLGKFKGHMVAVKTVRNSASDSDKQEFIDECEVMLQLRHEGLVQLLGVAIQQKPWLCVIEFMKYGDLREVLRTCEEKSLVLTYLEQLTLAVQMARGLAFIASKRFIHMDIAARNVLISESNKLKIADFGLTRALDEGEDTYTLRKTAKLPIRWMALEGLRTKIFSEKSDVWAYGVTLHEIATYGKLPYAGIKNKDVAKHILNGGRPVKPQEPMPEEFFDLAASCWRDDPQARPPFAELATQLTAMGRAAKASCPAPRDIGQTLSTLK